MSGADPKAAPSIVVVRFVNAIKLGPSEVSAFHAEKIAGWLCEPQRDGLVFLHAGGVTELFVPWANVISVERGRKS